MKRKPSERAVNAGQAGEPPAESIRHELEKILASEAFVNSGRLSRFLRFTVEEALQGRGDQLKESFLGVEVFDREPSYDPRTDPIVRVEAGRLRNKLASYYEGEGRADPVLIEFKKGGYVPAFQCRSAEAPRPAPGRIRSRARALTEPKTLLLAAALVAAGMGFYRASLFSRRISALEAEVASQKKTLPREFMPIWGPFISSGAENIVVFGSPMFFNSERYRLFVRIPSVNDMAGLRNSPDFQKLQERFGDLLGPRFDYASMGDAMALQRLTAFFARAGRAVKAVPAHQAVWESITNSNLIFLGAPRMNPLLQRLPFRQDFQVGPPDTHVYNLNPQPGEEKIYTTPSHRDALTYAVVASFPGLRPHREIMVLSAHQTSGLLGAVDYVTESETARTMSERLELSETGSRKHYQMLLRVFADKDEPVKTEYVTHHAVQQPVPKH